MLPRTTHLAHGFGRRAGSGIARVEKLVGEEPRMTMIFILGALKAGTTGLYSRLAGSDDVDACAVKEPNFFAPDLRDQFSSVYRSQEKALELVERGVALHQASIRDQDAYDS